MKQLNGKNVLLGITGGIAAYKSVVLARRLMDQGASVRVVMTEAATEFIAPLTFEAVCGHPVKIDMFGPRSEAATVHIELARWPDLIVIAPATANTIAKLANGIADNLLTSTCLAARGPSIAIAPAMNIGMWSNPATRDNCEKLKERGFLIWGPASGYQACGEIGEGRMLEPGMLAEYAVDALLSGPAHLTGVRVVITAGPTREAVDPVRFISNRSSGKMGFAVARACARMGAEVTLVSGPVDLPDPRGVTTIRVESAREMHEAVFDRIKQTDMFIGAAAVADYRIEQIEEHKIKKSSDELQLSLIRNPDILKDVAALDNPPFTVGFAAETRNLADYAKEKLASKKIDMIAANLVGVKLGFETETNELQVFYGDRHHHLPRNSKEVLAMQLMELIQERYHATTKA